MPLPEVKLLSKVQKNNFEPGEFIEEAERTCKETIQLIETFPWRQQWEGYAMDLTGPSITINGNDLSYLKVLPYYNHKYVLYYFDGKQLYLRAFLHLKDTYFDIEKYFTERSVDLSKYKQQTLLLKNVNNHFKSNDFVYRVKGKSFIHNMSGITKLGLLFFLPLMLLILIKGITTSTIIGFLLILILVFPLLGGINLLLTWNYFKHSKGKLLQLSKGSSTFIFGYSPNPVVFNKDDVTEIKILENNSYQCPWGDFTVTYIYLKNGQILTINSLLLSGYDIATKIPTAPFRFVFKTIPLQ